MELRFRIFRGAAVAVIIVTGLLVSEAAAIDLESLLRNPQRYHGDRVSIVGVVVGDGPEFELYSSANAARQISDPSQSVFVRARPEWRRERPFNLHLVRVTGTVDAKHHGIWGNPCEISLEHIEALSKEPVTHSKIPTGLFRNERSDTVSVRLLTTAESIQGAFELGPGDSVGLPIGDGKIQVLNGDGSVVVEDTLGIHRGSKYYDRKHGAFYYRIVGNRLEKVLPSNVKYWSWNR